MYFTASVIPLLAFTLFLGAHAGELYKPQHPHYSVALDVSVALGQLWHSCMSVLHGFAASWMEF